MPTFLYLYAFSLLYCILDRLLYNGWLSKWPHIKNSASVQVLTGHLHTLPVKRGHMSTLLHLKGTKGKKAQNHFLITSIQNVSSTRTGLARTYFLYLSTSLLTKPPPQRPAVSTNSFTFLSTSGRLAFVWRIYCISVTTLQVSFRGGLAHVFC